MHEIRVYVKDLKAGDSLRTPGTYYAPYNKIRCIWRSDHVVVAHVQSHKQYWGQNVHFIPASILVFKRVREDETGPGIWIAEEAFDKDTGLQWRQVRAEAIALAERLTRELRESNPTKED